MALLPLHKEVNLAELLEKLGLQDKQKLVQSELPYYDEYYISPSSSFLKLWNQEFISDPYIKSRGPSSSENSELFRSIETARH